MLYRLSILASAHRNEAFSALFPHTFQACPGDGVVASLQKYLLAKWPYVLFADCGPHLGDDEARKEGQIYCALSSRSREYPWAQKGKKGQAARKRLRIVVPATAAAAAAAVAVAVAVAVIVAAARLPRAPMM